MEKKTTGTPSSPLCFNLHYPVGLEQVYTLFGVYSCTGWKFVRNIYNIFYIFMNRKSVKLGVVFNCSSTIHS